MMWAPEIVLLPGSSARFQPVRNLRSVWPMQTLWRPIPRQKKVAPRRFVIGLHSPTSSGNTGAPRQGGSSLPRHYGVFDGVTRVENLIPISPLHQRLIQMVVAQRQRAIRIDLLPARPPDRITHALHFEFSFQPQTLPLDACRQHQHGLMNALRFRIPRVDAA